MEEAKIVNDWLAVRNSPIHGWGAFARFDIPSGTRVIEYVGEKITKAESLRRCEARNDCVFALNEEQDLDGNVAWNPARVINHSCAPNCEAEKLEGRIWIITRRRVGRDEEITFNYGFDLEDYRHYPCHCGARDCVGYILAEELFAQARAARKLREEVGVQGGFAASQ